MVLVFTYGGVVENNQDPLKLGRLKVRVPQVYGCAGGTGYIGTNDLPWALPVGLPAGSNKFSGGFSHLPEVGDKVWVRFLDGEQEKPIWEWGMQAVQDQEVFGLHSYKSDPGQPVGKPDRAAWTKYSHAIELNEGAVIATTSQGYNLMLTDASAPGSLDGSVKLSTAKGQFIKLDDLDLTGLVSILQDLTFLVGGDWKADAEDYTFNALTGDFNVAVDIGKFTVTATSDILLNTASNFQVDALEALALTAQTEMNLTTIGPMNLDFSRLILGTGSTQPFVLGTQFVAWISSLFQWLSLHTHTSGESGSPTSPPNIPPLGVVQPDSSALISQTIFGR